LKVLRGDLHALLANALNLGLQRPRVQHDAVTDNAQRAAHNARGQQRQLEHLLADDQRVTSVVATLEAHHHVGALGEPVNDLTLAFVAPLGADNHYVGHDYSLSLPIEGTPGHARPPALSRPRLCLARA